jgi:citrate synthase
MTDQISANEAAAQQWWRTAIIDIKPGEIGIRGYPIEQLIGRLSFPQMISLMVRGDIPSDEHAALLEAALVSAVDHGPQAPSIAVARMSMTCGVGINNAMASAVNVLGDVHGGAGQQCMELYESIAQRKEPLEVAVAAVLDEFQSTVSKIIPGFGHRFHPIDPRSIKLLDMLDQARARGTISGRYIDIGRAVEAELGRRTGKRLPMNIDGATAVVYCELGFPPALGRGLFILSRSVGILAHAYEQSQSLERIKGPMPPRVPYTYTGPARRDFKPED